MCVRTHVHRMLGRQLNRRVTSSPCIEINSSDFISHYPSVRGTAASPCTSIDQYITQRFERWGCCIKRVTPAHVSFPPHIYRAAMASIVRIHPPRPIYLATGLGLMAVGNKLIHAKSLKTITSLHSHRPWQPQLHTSTAMRQAQTEEHVSQTWAQPQIYRILRLVHGQGRVNAPASHQ